MQDYTAVADEAAINKTIEGLAARNITATVVADAAAAKQAVLALLPKGAEVFAVTSKTLEALGLDTIINESGDYDSVRQKLHALQGDDAKKQEQRRLGSAPEYVVGSVHAVAQDGQVLIASNTGSQLPAYAYGAGHVIWVVGAQKITPSLDEAHRRLLGHVVPLENERSLQAYGAPTNLSKLLIFSKEVNPERVQMIIVKEALGF
jgi:hypothetical protein